MREASHMRPPNAGKAGLQLRRSAPSCSSAPGRARQAMLEAATSGLDRRAGSAILRKMAAVGCRLNVSDGLLSRALCGVSVTEFEGQERKGSDTQSG